MMDELYKKIEEANKKTVTTNIKNKDYVMVNQRVKAFRMVFPLGSIQTEIVAMKDGIVMFKACCYDNMGELLATGYAQEKESSSFINQTSYIENCETSAIGRALGFCGFGIDSSIASYEEVANAKKNQTNKKATERDKLYKELEALERQYGASKQFKTIVKAFMDNVGVTDVSNLNIQELKDLKQLITSNISQFDTISF